ncbi:MYB-like protein [Niveomyces insectorum RCEF 264]|uniref:MYB-like protein n=1 Tax=Niveomyces insectorum RCEF 264 TaxID=1081102 RepID=A0A162MDW2_9HYPO|nr:MYB-like protein [Niveomyces insectorum RCEF 264]
MLLSGFSCDQSQPSPAPFAPLARIPSGNGAGSTGPGAAAAAAAAAALALASPPASPPQMSAPNTLGNLFTTCRSLQALLASPATASSYPVTPPQPTMCQPMLATPPLAHAPSPMKLRLRSRKASVDNSDNTATAALPTVARKRIVKRGPPPRGLNKRRRAVDDDMGRDDSDNDGDAHGSGSGDEFEASYPSSSTNYNNTTNEPVGLSLLAPSPLRRFPSSPSAGSPFASRTRAAAAAAAAATDDLALASSLPPPPPRTTATTPPRPQTPKRARIAPEALPLGLARGDFHALHADGIPDDSSRSSNNQNNNDNNNATADSDVEVERDGETWSTEEDRMLVELVLEKLKLSKTEWQDCARSLGKKDRHSLGRRWKSLMLHGDIGLKTGTRARRSKLHGTWR